MELLEAVAELQRVFWQVGDSDLYPRISWIMTLSLIIIVVIVMVCEDPYKKPQTDDVTFWRALALIIFFSWFGWPLTPMLVGVGFLAFIFLAGKAILLHFKREKPRRSAVILGPDERRPPPAKVRLKSDSRTL